MIKLLLGKALLLCWDVLAIRKLLNVFVLLMKEHFEHGTVWLSLKREHLGHRGDFGKYVLRVWTLTFS